MTGHLQSILAEQAAFTLDISVAKEACPLGLAPTNSTTVTLVLGDALAIALLEARGFTREDFAASHPGGMLGKRLLIRVENVMQTGERIPKVPPTAYIRQTLSEMSRTQLGICAVVDAQNYLLGVFSDGDLRRALDNELNVHSTPVSEVMTVGGITMKANQLAAEALHWMDNKHIHAMLVINDQHQVIGAFNIHDLLARGVL
jgi:arabinose-5-phosphate isomerase